MPDRIPMTEARLREAMRDPRYWQQGDPDRASYNAWVSESFRALNAEAESSGGVVHVRAYVRNGRHVAPTIARQRRVLRAILRQTPKQTSKDCALCRARVLFATLLHAAPSGQSMN